jgi:hypothetical protein
MNSATTNVSCRLTVGRILLVGLSFVTAAATPIRAAAIRLPTRAVLATTLIATLVGVAHRLILPLIAAQQALKQLLRVALCGCLGCYGLSCCHYGDGRRQVDRSHCVPRL